MEKNVKWFDHLVSVLALPFFDAVIIPVSLIFLTLDYDLSDPTMFFTGAILTIFGVYFLWATTTVLVRKGKGTIASWNPSKALVTSGFYERVRNPMILSVTLILLGESFLLNSLTITAWTVLFFIINHGQVTLFEEPHLRKKFGKKYEAYHKKTPKWIPKRKKFR